MSGDNGFRFAGYHPIISCEGTAEQVAVDILLEADALVFSEADVVDVTRLRKASDIQDNYLNLDYDWPVCSSGCWTRGKNASNSATCTPAASRWLAT